MKIPFFKMSSRLWNLIFPILLVFAANEFRKSIVNFFDSAPTVTIGLGKIRGNFVRTNAGDLLYTFRGIRYAQSPVNELRFAVNFRIFYYYSRIYSLCSDL